MKLKDKALKELIRSQKDIAWLAYYDELTSLPNRIFFNQTLSTAINHSKRHNKFLAILLINLDGFDKINNQLGQKKGDEVLKEISSRLLGSLRAEDVLARLDGDEFIILLNDIGKPKFASAVAEKLLSAIKKPIKINFKEITVTASIGISVYPNDGGSLEDLVTNADSALIKAKQNDGGRFFFHTPEIDLEAREYIKLKNDLLNAIKNKEFTLYYQPKMHLKKGNITGVEALIRWIHPELGVISPGQFITVAEEAGFMPRIGEWILHEACMTNKRWQDEGYEHMTMAVNLSSQQFRDPQIVQTLNKILEETKLDPQFLELEITEKTVMDDVNAALPILEQIKSTGVQLSIDHFGTGYTSISHLKKFPVSILKIDQSYIKGVPNTPNDTAITNAFIGLAHNLGLEVVAEGVETAEQVQYLSTQNCDIVQGYFLSQPLPAPKVVLQFKKLMDEVIL